MRFSVPRIVWPDGFGRTGSSSLIKVLTTYSSGTWKVLIPALKTINGAPKVLEVQAASMLRHPVYMS